VSRHSRIDATAGKGQAALNEQWISQMSSARATAATSASTTVGLFAYVAAASAW